MNQAPTSFRLPPAAPTEPALLVRRAPSDGPPVLYVHGATFPSALSFNWRFAGRSWADDLQARGFDAWSFDLEGYGGSDRPECLSGPPDRAPPALRAQDAARQIARVVDEIRSRTGGRRVSIVAHSWGTMPAGSFAGEASDSVERLVLFGPPAERQGPAAASALPAWRRITVRQQLDRFVEDVPAGHAPVLLEPELATWGPAYLATCAFEPDAVRTPAGPAADIAEAWSGRLPWSPADLRCPTLIVRGAWDSVCDDADAAWLAARIGAECWDVRIPAATHLMHLERGRERLFAATAAFLAS